MVVQGGNPGPEMILAFCHPSEQNGMDLTKPKKSGVVVGKEKTDLSDTLQETKVLDKQAWKTTYTELQSIGDSGVSPGLAQTKGS